MAYQSRDLVEAMQHDAGQALTRLRVDGGASANDVLTLIAKIQEHAMRERKIELHTEVQIVGQDEPVYV